MKVRADAFQRPSALTAHTTLEVALHFCETGKPHPRLYWLKERITWPDPWQAFFVTSGCARRTMAKELIWNASGSRARPVLCFRPMGTFFLLCSLRCLCSLILWAGQGGKLKLDSDCLQPGRVGILFLAHSGGPWLAVPTIVMVLSTRETDKGVKIDSPVSVSSRLRRSSPTESGWNGSGSL